MSQMQLVKYTVVTLVRRPRPEMVADRLVLEVSFPAGPIGQLQVLGLDLGDDMAMGEDRVGGGRQRVVPLVRRMRLTLLPGAADDNVDRVIVVEAAA